MQPLASFTPPAAEPPGDLQHRAEVEAARWERWSAALLALLCEA